MQISIGDGALGSRQQFVKSGGLMREHDMSEAALAKDFADAKLMRGMRVAMHEANGGSGDAFGDRIECGSSHRGFIEW